MKAVLGIFFSFLLSVLPAAGALDFQEDAISCGCSMERCCMLPASSNSAPVQNIPTRPQQSAEALAVLPAKAAMPIGGPEDEFRFAGLNQRSLITSLVPLFQRYCSFLI